MTDDLPSVIENVVRKAPADWLHAACELLRSLPSEVDAEFVLHRLPPTLNADLSFLMGKLVRIAAKSMSWEALCWSLSVAGTLHRQWQNDHQCELLWGGPSPANRLPVRRIDQTLYDLIPETKREILLVTFAAVKIARLSDELLKARQRNVRIRLILEFEETSEGQLTFDALRAFPHDLTKAVEIYRWPVEKRERNLAGRPGKLHAKVAILDETVLISSANLTDDAFTRNMEVGIKVQNSGLLAVIKGYFDSLIVDGTLEPAKP